MAFNIADQLKNKESIWMNTAFYMAITLLVAVVFSYGIFSFKVSLENQKIVEVDNRIATYGTEQQKIAERSVFEYKKKIDDFAVLVASHKISSNVLTFVEEKTLPNVWFSNFSMSDSTNILKLTGEAENMEVFGRQVGVFEQNQDYIKNISVLDSQLDSNGKAKFSISFFLEPKVFNYVSDAMPVVPNTQ